MSVTKEDSMKFTDEFIRSQFDISEAATQRPWVFIPSWGLYRNDGIDGSKIASMPELDERDDDFYFLENAANHYPEALMRIDELQIALKQIDEIIDLWDIEGTMDTGALEVWSIVRNALGEAHNIASEKGQS